MNENILDWLETDDFDTFDEALDGEYIESPFEGEDLDTEFYGESDDAESRASRRRRARARRAAQLRRRRQALAAGRRAGRAGLRGRGAPSSRRLPASTSDGREIQKAQEGIEKAREGIEKVELENQVQSDVFGRALIKQQQRIGRNEHALAASIVRGELERHFPNLVKEPALQSAMALLPNVMLGFGRGAKGIEGVLTHPAVWSAVATLGIAVIARTRQETLVVRIFPTEPPEIVALASPPDNQTQLTAVVQDKNGVPLLPQPQITWSTVTPSIADVDSTGKVTAKAPGTAVISATAPNAQAGVATVIVR